MSIIGLVVAEINYITSFVNWCVFDKSPEHSGPGVVCLVQNIYRRVEGVFEGFERTPFEDQ